MWPHLRNSRVCTAYLGLDAVWFSAGSQLFRETHTDGAHVLRDFAGASRGLRMLSVTGADMLYASPEGGTVEPSERGLWRHDGSVWSRVIDLSAFPNPTCIWGFEAARDGTLFAGAYTTARDTRACCIFVSRDHGARWTECYSDMRARHVHAITSDPITGAIYASIGDDFGIWNKRAILKSLDQGSTWTPILLDVPQSAPAVCVPGARIFGSDHDGDLAIYRSEDDATYRRIPLAAEPEYFFWMRVDHANCLVVGGTVAGGSANAAAHIYLSRDLGQSWAPIVTRAVETKWDGFPNASNIHDSRILVARRNRGVTETPVLIDLIGREDTDGIQ